MKKSIKNVIESIHEKISKNGELAEVINNGGCGAFAYYFLMALEKHNIKANVVYLDGTNRYNDVQEIQSNLAKAKKGFNVSAWHVMIKVGKYYVDGRYINVNIPIEFSQCKILTFKIHSSFLKIAIRQPYQWNTQFDREHWSPYINRYIRESFKLLKK